jgi:uncharacterized membrane protein YoaK (UPF0700 family)
MVTGSLRSLGIAAFRGLRTRRTRHWRPVVHLGAVCLSFLIGTALGAAATPALHQAALGFPSA